MYQWKAGELITAEKLSPKILAGAELIQFTTPAGDYYRGGVYVAFPSGFFTTTPYVMLTARTAVPGVLIEVGYTNKSVDGFDLRAARHTTTETWIDWLAIEVQGS